MAESEELTRARARLALYYEAEAAILASQEYKIGTRSLKRADLVEVRAAIKDLKAEVAELAAKEAGRGKRWAGRIIPRDL
jgi:hypothetical protein